MDGPEIFKFAVNAVQLAMHRILEMAGLEREDLDYLIIHQGNYRILEAGARFAKVPMDKVFVNIHKYGNPSAASVPIALHEAQAEGKIKDGDKVHAGELRRRGHLGRDSVAVGREEEVASSQ